MTATSVLDLIGNTPLLRLNEASKLTGCEILGKAEFLNPGQSVKDRAALEIIRQAEASGALKPGGVVVEGTAGNTGIGLAMVCSALGYAELIEVDAVPYANPKNYVRYSEEVAKNTKDAIWANQFDNTANREAHIKTTGPEIWEQTDGKVDGFVCAVGSGGTLGGVSMSLKSKNENIKIGVADPFGSKMYSYYKTGELETEGGSVTEGIGQGRITKNLEGVTIDHAYRICDREALEIIFSLNQLEGLCLGGSSGINIAGAIELAKELGPGHTIVTILCDYGQRYQSKIYNPEFLRAKDLPVPSWLC